MTDTPNRSAMLSGCRVLDFTQYLAGPTVTRLMAEMGADIIKVEIAPMGDPARLLPTLKAGRSGYFVQQNRGKNRLSRLKFAVVTGRSRLSGQVGPTQVRL
jgi:crotonobetainyl-CoA:carnitine CoA-transferase CaiB-like acyl-CoA transferase